MPNCQNIKDFIFDKAPSLEEKKERFNIAWDIYSYFREMFSELGNRIFPDFMKKLKQNNKDYLFRYCYTKDEQTEELWIFKEDWTQRPMEPILYYIVYTKIYEHSAFTELCIGLRKKSDDIPFVGSLTDNPLPEELKVHLKDIEKSIVELEYITDSSFLLSKEGLLAIKGFHEELIVEKIAEGGMDALSEYLFFEFMKLVNTTERHIDAFISKCKSMFM